MRILQVVKTNRGATWAYNQALELKREGIELITVLPSLDEGYASKYRDAGMKMIKGEWSLPVTKPWKFFSRAKEIQKVVALEKPDIMHLHFVTNVLMVRLALRKSKIMRLFQVPGPLHLEKALTSFVERKTATRVDYWAGACKWTCNEYLRNGIPKDKVFLAYYGVPQGGDTKIAQAAKIHDEYNILPQSKIVAMISYFYKPKKIMGQTRGLKGHEDFIDAMQIVLKSHPNVIPMIIGNAWDGSEDYELTVKEYAKKVLRGKVIFTGYRNDVVDVYREISIAVHPSHSENLGGAAESLANGVPTIASNIGGFPDIVIEGETGLLVEPKNPYDLAEKIIWALEHEDEMIKMAEKGKHLVEKLLDISNTASRIHEVYLDMQRADC